LTTPDETISLPDGRTLTQRALYIEALRHDPANSLAYLDLGISLQEGESVALPDGRMLTARQLLLECIRYDPSNRDAHVRLARTVPDKMTRASRYCCCS
jgi:hypothetical protein